MPWIVSDLVSLPYAQLSLNCQGPKTPHPRAVRQNGPYARERPFKPLSAPTSK